MRIKTLLSAYFASKNLAPPAPALNPPVEQAPTPEAIFATLDQGSHVYHLSLSRSGENMANPDFDTSCKAAMNLHKQTGWPGAEQQIVGIETAKGNPACAAALYRSPVQGNGMRFDGKMVQLEQQDFETTPGRENIVSIRQRNQSPTL